MWYLINSKIIDYTRQNSEQKIIWLQINKNLDDNGRVNYNVNEEMW